LLKKADAVKTLVNTSWWDDSTHHFYSTLNKDHKLEGQAGSALLYRDIADGAKATAGKKYVDGVDLLGQGSGRSGGYGNGGDTK
jgi:hypothetical protein